MKCKILLEANNARIHFETFKIKFKKYSAKKRMPLNQFSHYIAEGKI